MHYKTRYASPLGGITLASDDAHLIGLWLDGQKYHGDALYKEMVEKDDLAIFDTAKQWLDRYFDGKRPAISELPLAPIGSAFRQAVWKILCEIPYGKVTTYGAIAKEITAQTGKHMSGQAVGGAVGHNPISLIIPCHRVVGGNGSLTGYAGGVQVKAKLLEWEGVTVKDFFVQIESM